MPSESVLDFDALLAPIAGDEPQGQSLPFAVKQQLEELRKEVNPDDYDADDPTRPTEAKFADWGGIIRLTKQTLAETTKDLLVAARLTEALTKRHGYGGLADGLVLMRRMVSECWDRMYPDISDGDLEVRAGPFNWLGDGGRGALFPASVRSVPMLGEGSFSWLDWKQTQSGKPELQRKVDAGIAGATREQAQLAAEDADRAFEELLALDRVLEEKLGRDAPGMTDLKAAVGEVRNLTKQILSRKGPAAEEAAPAEAAGGAEASGDTGGGGASPARAMRSRADVYARLAEAADLLEQLEPHSPIPYFVRRAVELGAMPFPQLMKALIRDRSVLEEMHREMGIKDEEN